MCSQLNGNVDGWKKLLNPKDEYLESAGMANTNKGKSRQLPLFRRSA